MIAKIEDLTMTIEKLAKAIETLKSEIGEMQVQITLFDFQILFRGIFNICDFRCI